MKRSRLSLLLALTVFCAQLLLAWHAPSHILIDEQDHDHHSQILAIADCQVCTHGQGLQALPSLFISPVAQPVRLTPPPPTLRALPLSARPLHPARGPPSSV